RIGAWTSKPVKFKSSLNGRIVLPLIKLLRGPRWRTSGGSWLWLRRSSHSTWTIWRRGAARWTLTSSPWARLPLLLLVLFVTHSLLGWPTRSCCPSRWVSSVTSWQDGSPCAFWAARLRPVPAPPLWSGTYAPLQDGTRSRSPRPTAPLSPCTSRPTRAPRWSAARTRCWSTARPAASSSLKGRTSRLASGGATLQQRSSTSTRRRPRRPSTLPSRLPRFSGLG
ncbi:unnamed protein product, partial [Prorocentrum cordatum]